MPTPWRDPWERFMEKVAVVPETGCWEWQGFLTAAGYSRFWSDDQKNVFGHRFAWGQRYGTPPEGHQIDHLCRNRACVNPEHLEAVTARENVLRGDTVVAANAAKTHCDHGHEFTAANTYIHPQRGSRNCRACRADATRRYQMKKVS